MTPIPLGTPIWVQLRDVPSGREVSEIRLSLAWRRTSDSTAQDRIPESLRPCQHKDKLCPSCLVFGSAGSDDQDPDGPTEQNSYRGHVRFADALADHPVHKERFRRAPLASPKPTAGQFYLDNSAAEGRFHPTTPLAQWDSTADYRKDGELDARRIRGRKFYWRTRDNGILPGPQHRGRHWGSRNDAMGDDVTVMAVGSTFTTRVTFDNLTTAQIGSLLAALDPSQALGGKCVISVGGGRPFGWGGVAATISEFTAQSATSRYAGSPAASPTAQECVTAYRDSMAGQPGRSEWDTLAKLLTVNPPGVQDAHVWYPPNPRPGFQRGTQRYDEGFEFWQKSNGFELTKPPHRPLKSLPQADATDQNIPGVL